MTLKDLQNVLGTQISNVISLNDKTSEEYQMTMEKSDVIARLSKQMINNADVILRADKLIAEGILDSSSTIVELVDR